MLNNYLSYRVSAAGRVECYNVHFPTTSNHDICTQGNVRHRRALLQNSLPYRIRGRFTSAAEGQTHTRSGVILQHPRQLLTQPKFTPLRYQHWWVDQRGNRREAEMRAGLNNLLIAHSGSFSLTLHLSLNWINECETESTHEHGFL